MICGHQRPALCATGILFLSFGPASAQESTILPTTRARIVSVPDAAHLVRSARVVTVTVTEQQQRADVARQLVTSASRLPVGTADQAKPPSGKPPTGRPETVPAVKTSPVQRSTRAIHQGFSVVLVLADLTGSTAQDDVPPAARRALADMKDFLPYKSYKLLDAAWVLGQGQQSIRLRGPEGHEYELRLITQSYGTSSGRVPVQFSLRDVDSQEDAAAAAVLAETADGSARRTKLELELAQAREKSDQPRVRALERELAAMRARSATSHRRRVLSNRQIIDTSFTMEVGETVVVGTSRLKGNSSALIALLTAVPPRSSVPRESR